MPQTKEPAENKVIDMGVGELLSRNRENLQQVARSQKNPRTTSKELQGLLAWVKVSVHYSTIWTRLCKNNTWESCKVKTTADPKGNTKAHFSFANNVMMIPMTSGKVKRKRWTFWKVCVPLHLVWKLTEFSRKWTSGKRTWWWLGDYLGLLGASGSGRLAVTEGTIDSNLYHKILKQ